ncbi:MAG: prepilin-type N-terminal cleavage/methylation domain-containing protein [Candidatus Omnitrophica bacterium]|nr:prepilin-type N-terminal cleavage/methylation domain-containing protein [Candidatus Omnitrophota bacterium]
MKNNTGVTLLELLIALGLLGLMVVFIGSIGSEMYAMKKEFLDKQRPFVQGHIASMTMFERILRAGTSSPGTSATTYTIAEDGSAIEYKRSGLTERIFLAGSSIRYSDGSAEKVILKDVKNLRFAQDYGRRVAVEIELNSGEKYRTAVVPRNEFTPQKIIN